MDKNSISKQLITLCILDLDYCANTFGIAPCTATGTPKCYNTFKTCRAKINYLKTTKSYRYINNDAPPSAAAEFNARPYIIQNSSLSTELKDDKTIPARGTITFADEIDYDQGIDPYLYDRRSNLIDGKGYHFKKLIERNSYYKGRIITIKQGYPGQSESSFTTIFSGKIDNIKRNKLTVDLEYTDDIVDLSKVEYPYKTNIKLTSDLGACYEVGTFAEALQLNAITGDYALVREFNPTMDVNVSGGAVEPASFHCYYSIVAYNSNNNPISRQDHQVGYATGSEWLTFNITAPTGVSYYRLFGPTGDMATYHQFTGISYSCTVNTVFENVGTPPDKAERYLKLLGTHPSDPYWWDESITLTIDLTALTGLPSTGYIQIDEEVIYYGALGTLQLLNIRRVRHKSKTAEHYATTNIKLVEWETPANPFTLLKQRFQRAGIPDSRIDLTTFNTYATAYSGITFSTKPIVKSTNAGKLIFNFANTLDVSIWVNESGKVTCKKNNEEAVDYNITDAENIVLDSKSVDFNTEEIKTRINFYWNRNDVTKGLDDEENYSNRHIEINADAEGPNMYDEELSEDILTTWINDDCAPDTATINTWVAAICAEKLRRKMLMRAKLTFDVEQKDSMIQVGHIVSLSSNAFNDVDGNDYQNRKAQVVKKTNQGLKIELVVRLLATDAITTTSQDDVIVYENPLPVKNFGLNEVAVTNFKVYDINNVVYTTDILDVQVEIKLKLEFDNMYASAATTATDILGVTHSLPKRLIYAGYPPEPWGEEVDTSSWKTVRRYKVYMFVANAGQKYPVIKRPTTSDANGKWYVIGIVPDLKSNDITKKYNFDWNLPISLVGRYIGFAIYADANIVYDPNAAVGIEIGALT